MGLAHEGYYNNKSMFELISAYATRIIFNLLYLPLWVFPVQNNKVSIFSRQSSTPSIDIQLLVSELKEQNPNLKIIVMVHRDDGGVKGSISMMGTYVKSLYHMATSKVCVLESYWPPLSICKRRPNTKVVQMWHSIGKVKQSGLIAAGRPGGRSAKLSKAMRMHKGYDFIIAGAPAWNRFYIDSFDCDEAVLRNVGLPRIDHLVNDRVAISAKIIKEYPELAGKTVVLYAPTFRRGGNDIAQGLLNELERLDKGEFAIVVKSHPNQHIDPADYDVLTCPNATAVDLLCVADYLITDYSAIALEGAALDVKTLYYVPDYAEYQELTGLNIDIYKEMPGCVFERAQDVTSAIKGEYPVESLQKYKGKFLFEGIGGSATAIANVVFDEAGLSR